MIEFEIDQINQYEEDNKHFLKKNVFHEHPFIEEERFLGLIIFDF